MQQTVFLLPFLPLVLLLVESITIQSLGLTAQSQLETASIRKLGWDLLSGAVLGLVLTLVVGSIMAAAGWPIRVTLCVGGTVAVGMTAGALAGWGVPSFLRRLRWDGRVAAGFIARTLADAGAVLIYFSLARWLLR
jgi:Mg/Co/Ni transporter MgtE